MLALAFSGTGCRACSEVRDEADFSREAEALDDGSARPDGPTFHELPADAIPTPDGGDVALDHGAADLVGPGDVARRDGEASDPSAPDAPEPADAASPDADGAEPPDGGVTDTTEAHGEPPAEVVGEPSPEGSPDSADAASDPVADLDVPGPGDDPCSGVSCRSEVPAGFALVQPGTFLMGSAEDEPGRGTDEGRHQVQLTRRLLVGRREVTQAEWRAVLGNAAATSWYPGCGDACPAENVNWWSALKYCNQRSLAEGFSACYVLAGCTGSPGGSYKCDQVSFVGLDCDGYRLPTEAEWEYAARAGTTTALFTGDLPLEHLGLDAPEVDTLAWYGGNSGVTYANAWNCSAWKDTQYPATTCGTHPVQQKVPNPWGLYDTSGNVWEWCWDAWEPFQAGVAATDPLGSADPTFRTLRGGSWMIGAARLRSANRGRYEPDVRNGATGLRVVRTLP